MIYVEEYSTPDGLDDLRMASDGAVLTALHFVESPGGRRLLESGGLAGEVPVFSETRRWLDSYFAGDVPDWLPPYRIDGATVFRREVLELLLKIPFGQTTSYGALAQCIARRHGVPKMSAQAVGGTVGWNPLCIIIPCHRVIGADGNLTGYGGGLRNKIALLRHEAAFCNNERQ